MGKMCAYTFLPKIRERVSDQIALKLFRLYRLFSKKHVLLPTNRN